MTVTVCAWTKDAEKESAAAAAMAKSLIVDVDGLAGREEEVVRGQEQEWSVDGHPATAHPAPLEIRISTRSMASINMSKCRGCRKPWEVHASEGIKTPPQTLARPSASEHGTRRVDAG